MKKLLLILLCLPLIGFGQDNNLKKSKFNFNKSNNYGSIKKESNSVESYTNQKVQNSNDSIQKQNDKESNLIVNTKNNKSNIFFNKGLIGILSETMKKKQEVHKHTETIVNKNNETILYTLEIKKGEKCPVCKKTID
jgi:hypothetical protein